MKRLLSLALMLGLVFVLSVPGQAATRPPKSAIIKSPIIRMNGLTQDSVEDFCIFEGFHEKRLYRYTAHNDQSAGDSARFELRRLDYEELRISTDVDYQPIADTLNKLADRTPQIEMKIGFTITACEGYSFKFGVEELSVYNKNSEAAFLGHRNFLEDDHEFSRVYSIDGNDKDKNTVNIEYVIPSKNRYCSIEDITNARLALTVDSTDVSYWDKDGQVVAAFYLSDVYISAGYPLETENVIYDINDDDRFDALDVIRMKKEIASVKDEPNMAADVNGDGKVNVLDLILIKKAFANPEFLV